MKDSPRAVIPLRYVQSVDRMREWYIGKLGFQHMMGLVGGDGQLDFAIVMLDGAMMMLARPENPAAVTGGPLEIYVEVADVDACHGRFAKAGLEMAKPLITQWWGDRNFAVQDPAGHLIWFYQTVGEPAPPAGVKLV